MKATEQYFPVLLITLYKVILTFESVDEIPKCGHLNTVQACLFFAGRSDFTTSQNIPFS